MIKYHKNSNNLAMPYFGLCSGFFQKLETKGKEAVIDSPYFTEGNLKRGEKIKALEEKFTGLINANGKVESVENMGKKKLAYEIKKFKEATYMLFNFEAKPDSIKELE